MPLRLAADVEALVTGWLRAHPDIAALVGARVVTELPAQPTWPTLRILRVGGIADYPGWLDPASIQVEAWAATKESANDLARAALAALSDLPGTHAEGVVTHVTQNLGLTWAPDEATDQPRYLFGVAVYTHPTFQ